MVSNTNHLLLVENYIFGKLITSSTKTLVDMGLIQEVIKGINLFDEVRDFYNNKFLLDACAASMEVDKSDEKYKDCENDTLIISANNTDNLIKLIDNLVENIYKEHDMEKNSSDYFKQKLFNTSYFQHMEEVFYKYIIPVGDIFAKLVKDDLNKFLKNKKTLITILVVCLGVIMFIYCLYLGIFFVRKLVHYLSVSRCIMKIIPTSVIINTQELESWIENKY